MVHISVQTTCPVPHVLVFYDKIGKFACGRQALAEMGRTVRFDFHSGDGPRNRRQTFRLRWLIGCFPGDPRVGVSKVHMARYTSVQAPGLYDFPLCKHQILQRSQNPRHVLYHPRSGRHRTGDHKRAWLGRDDAECGEIGGGV